jgi:DNA-binding NarL/FixJ family response regulator
MTFALDRNFRVLTGRIPSALLAIRQEAVSISSTMSGAVSPSAMECVLSARQREVLTLVARGLSTDGIARELFVSPSTVRAHVRNILVALRARNRAHAVAIACTTGLIWMGDDAPLRHPGRA